MEKAHSTFLHHDKYDDNKSKRTNYNYKRMNSRKCSILPKKTKDYKNVLHSIEQYFSNSITYKNIGTRKKLREKLPSISGNGRKNDNTSINMKPATNFNHGCANIKETCMTSCDKNNCQCRNGCDFKNEENKNRQLSADRNLHDDENNNVEINGPIQGSLSNFKIRSR